jgi:hypothetical protein
LLDLKADSGRELCVLALVKGETEKIGFFSFSAQQPFPILSLRSRWCHPRERR